jgi:hypothetical protein
MLLILLIAGIVLLLPMALRTVRVLFRAHLLAVVLFLPAGLLLRYGPNQDLRLFACVTCLWGLILGTWLLSRRSARPVRA